MSNIDSYGASTGQSSLATNKMVRNTYMLLAMTMVFSAFTAAISMAIAPGMLAYFGSVILSFVLMFVLHKKQNTTMALPLVFGFTGLLGFGLGPLLNHYLAMSNGAELVTTALGMTAMTFFGLTAIVMVSKKDFSFMGGFLGAGAIIAVVAMIAMFVLPMFGVNVGGFQLAFSAFIVLLMAGFVLYDTSNIINGHYSNYIMATVSLYLSIYNMFVHILAILGMTSDD